MVDPESEKLWKELEKYWKKPCCQKVIDFMQRSKGTHVKFFEMGFLTSQVEINYCPECGEKLE
jgi:hypothetical protein